MRKLPSRIDKDPPASFYANLLGYLAETYPRASLDPMALSSLKPLWDDLWRAGRNAEVTAQSTCSCDGHTITPSPATQVDYARGAARPPTKAVRGVLYPVTELREASPVEQVKRKADAGFEHVKRIQAKIARFVESYDRSPPRTEEAAAKKRQQVRSLEAELASSIASTKSLLEDVETVRENYPHYKGLRKYLPALGTLPEERAALEVIAKPKPRKSAKPRAEFVAPTKNEETPEKTDKNAGKKVDKAEKPAKKGKLTEAEKQATLMAAIKEGLQAALAAQLGKK